MRTKMWLKKNCEYKSLTSAVNLLVIPYPFSALCLSFLSSFYSHVLLFVFNNPIFLAFVTSPFWIAIWFFTVKAPYAMLQRTPTLPFLDQWSTPSFVFMQEVLWIFGIYSAFYFSFFSLLGKAVFKVFGSVFVKSIFSKHIFKSKQKYVRWWWCY